MKEHVHKISLKAFGSLELWLYKLQHDYKEDLKIDITLEPNKEYVVVSSMASGKIIGKFHSIAEAGDFLKVWYAAIKMERKLLGDEGEDIDDDL